jgi:hypothetical protein
VAANCRAIFTPPGESEAEDWVLVVDDAKRDYAAPGMPGPARQIP